MPIGLFGLSSSRAHSTSSSQSSGFNVSGSRDSVFGADLFSELFSNASRVAGGINTDPLTTTANRLFDSGAGFIDELAALSGGGNVGPGEQYLAGELGGGDELVGQQIDALQSDLGEFFSETLMPGIKSDAIAAGGLGGTRQGVAEGIAGKGLLRSFAEGALGIRQNAQARRDSIAQTLATTQLQRRLAAAGAGIAALPAQFDMLEAGNLAALSPFMALADILGAPSILNDAFSFGAEQSSSTSSSKSKSVAFNVAGTGG